MDATVSWRIRKHVLLFVAGTFVGSFTWFPLATALGWLGIKAVSEEQSILKYGGTAVLIYSVFLGTLSFLAGAAIAKRVLPEPVYWSSAAAGCVYSAGVFICALVLPMARGSLAGLLFLAWVILLPALAIAVTPLVLKRPDPRNPHGGNGLTNVE